MVKQKVKNYIIFWNLENMGKKTPFERSESVFSRWYQRYTAAVPPFLTPLSLYLSLQFWSSVRWLVETWIPTRRTWVRLGNSVARIPPPCGVDRVYENIFNKSLNTYEPTSNMLAFDHHDNLSVGNGGQRLTQRYTAGESRKREKGR